MSACLLRCVPLIGLMLAPCASAAADTVVIPGVTTVDRAHPRPRYRQAAFPPPQYDLLGRRVALAPRARPSYRQEGEAFPPPGGRFGGGFLEYVLTGGRPEPIPPEAYAPSGPVSPSPVARFFSPGPYAAPNPGPLSPYPTPSLPRLPSLPVASASPVYAQPVYAPPVAGPPVGVLPVGGLPAVLPGVTLDGPQQAFAQPAPAYAGPRPMFNPPDGGGAFDADPQALAVDPRPSDRMSQPTLDPAYQRQEVTYDGTERPGTIIIDTPSKHLFLVRPGGRALRYGIGVGRPGFEWAGVKRISRKAEWPGWTPPADMLKRRPDLPRHMAGGEANPLGARALYLGSSMYRIHGTNEPGTIGRDVSSGCIRMMNADVIDLYGRVGVGTRVVVL